MAAQYILFDTETTGNQSQDRIIQVGAVVVKGRDSHEVYDEMCSTDTPISLEAMEVHHITPDMIVGKPAYDQSRFANMIERLNSDENYLIAHNIEFDLGMLQKEGFVSKYKLIDTLRCARHLMPEQPHHRLQYLRYALGLYHDETQEAQKLGVQIKAHDAIGDVVILKLLFAKLVQTCRQKYPDLVKLEPIEKLVELTNTPVLMQKFKFGKYKGEEISKIASDDMGYLKWMRKTLDLDDDMIYTLDYYIDQY